MEELKDDTILSAVLGQPAVNKEYVANPYLENVEIFDPDCGRLPVIVDDPYLQHHENDIKLRIREFRKWLQTFKDAEGGIASIARSYLKFGLNLRPNGDIEYSEWAPNAKGLTIFGDFNGWNREEFRC
mmetsp:Transcript_6309/g.10706  ORF Transcript_6309/g.10706 Transcript_6309/m.10706 type:complete len:128 (-) Transcript_6309:2115-2498(-)